MPLSGRAGSAGSAVCAAGLERVYSRRPRDRRARPPRVRRRAGPVAASLREHCAAGRLTLEELSERLDEAYRARTMIWTFAVLGGADIYVPEGVEVDAAGFAPIGGADVWRVPSGAK